MGFKSRRSEAESNNSENVNASPRERVSGDGRPRRRTAVGGPVRPSSRSDASSSSTLSFQSAKCVSLTTDSGKQGSQSRLRPAQQSLQGSESEGAATERSEGASAERPSARERPNCRKRGFTPDPEAGPQEGVPTGTTETERRGGAEAVPSGSWRAVAATLDATEGQHHE